MHEQRRGADVRRALEQPGILGTEALPEETVRYDEVEAAARQALSEARRTASAIDDREPPDEVREALEALGYVE